MRGDRGGDQTALEPRGRKIAADREAKWEAEEVVGGKVSGAVRSQGGKKG